MKAEQDWPSLGLLSGRTKASLCASMVLCLGMTGAPAADGPVITQQPLSQTVIAGGNAAFTVETTRAALSYQWRFHGLDMPGANASVLIVSNVQPANAGGYSVVVTDSFGAVTSVVATLTVNFSLTVRVNGFGTVNWTPVLSSYPPGTIVTLTAISGFTRFRDWSGDASGTNNPLAVTMTSNKVITARFGSVLTLSTIGQGTVAKAPDQLFYNVGDRVTLTAIPARWFGFSFWLDEVNANPRVITVGITNIYTAVFFPTTALETLTFSNVTRVAPVGMPAIFVDGRFITNAAFTRLRQAEISMRTTFTSGSIFYTTDGSQPSFASSFYTDPFVVHRTALLRAVAYDANFTKWWEADPLQLNIVPGFLVNAGTLGGGSLTVVPQKAVYRSNDVISLIASPSPGWQFLHWLGDVNGSSTAIQVPVRQDLCAEAIFGTTLTNVIAGSGSIILEPSGPLYPFGTTVRMTGVPAAGNHFAAWGNAASGTSNPLYFTVTNANQTISAAFAPLAVGQYALTVLINGHGQVTTSPRANRYTIGQAVTLKAIADTEQEFLGWSGDATGAQTNITVVMNQSRVVTANFTARPRLSVDPCGGGWTPGGFRMRLTGDFGVRYEIEGSPDALEWSRFVSVTNTFGVTEVLDPPRNIGRRFYRAVVP